MPNKAPRHAGALRIAPDLELPLEVVTEAIAILARRRAGKSYTARKIVEQLLDASQQTVIIDPKGDWWGLRSSADGKWPGYPILVAGGEHGDVPLEPSSGEILARFVVEERISVLLDLSGFRKHEVATFMAAFLETLYRLKAKEQYRTPLMLVFEEADAIAPQKTGGGAGKGGNVERMLGAAEDIVRRGGQRGIGSLMVTQRAAVLNKNVLSVAPWMRAPVWQGFRGKALRSMEELWEQATRHRCVQQADGYEFVEFPTNANTIKTLCWQNGMGQWAPIKRVIRHWYEGNLIRLSQKWGEVVVTPNHSVYTANGALGCPQDNPELLAVRHINQQRTRATSSVALSFPDSNCFVEDGWIRWRDRMGRPGHAQLKRELSGGDLAAFVRFLGAWLSEGSVHVPGWHRPGDPPPQNTYIIQVCNADRSWLESVARDLNCVVRDTGVRIDRSSTDGVWNLCVSHAALGKWLAHNCGKGAADKRLPDFVFDLSRRYADALIRNLVKGDGSHTSGGRWAYYTQSSELAQGLGFLCSLHGLDYTVHRDETTGVYRLTQLEWYKPTSVASRVMAEVPHSGYVYDLEIDHGYTPNFTIGVGNVVVHNTQAGILIALRTVGPQDLAALDDWIRLHGTPEQRQILMSSLPSLPTGDVWVWAPGWPTDEGIFQRTHIAPITTFDSGATPKPGQKIAPPKSVAEVDLGALKELLSASIEKAKANDPQVLRQRIADLERELAARPTTTKVETREVRVEVPVFDQRQVSAVAEAANSAARAAAELATVADRLLEASGQLLKAVNAVPAAQPIEREAPRQPVPRIDPVPREHKCPATALPPAPRPERVDARLGSGERKVLAVLAQYPQGRTNKELAFLAGYSAKASTLGVILSKLRKLGYVTPSGEPQITEAGRSAIGPVEALPTGPALLECWHRHPRMGAGERKVLGVLIEHYPDELSHDALCQLAGYSPRASTVGVILSKLRKLGLVDTDARRVSPEFMAAIASHA